MDHHSQYVLPKDYLKNIVDLNNYQVNCYYFNKLVWFYKSFLKQKLLLQ